MIIFHEGMPRSGKSYAAVKDHLLPALAKGRRCYVRIDGLNFKQIAELAGRTEDETRALLTELSESDVARLAELEIAQDAFILIDEAQNYWPKGRQALPPGITKWVAEHGHHGLDVLLMGQLLKDVHSTWVNRTNRKVQFIKKDVVGKDGEYKWIMFHGSPDSKGNVVFREVSRGDGTYEPRYFGTYKSHSEGTENKETYKDDRANIFKSAIFRKWLPLYGVFALVALGVVVWAFSGGLVPEEVKKGPQQVKSEPARSAPVATASAPVPKAVPVAPPVADYMPLPANDLIDEFTTKYRARLSGFIEFRGKKAGFIEWRDPTDNGVKEVLTLAAVQGLGWLVLVSPDGQMAMLQKINKKYYVTAWPIDDWKGKVSQSELEKQRPPQEPRVSHLAADSGMRPDTPRTVTAGSTPPANDSTNPRFNVSLRQ